MTPRSQPRANAFTLTEILAVIAIIALLAALLFPALQRIMASGSQTKSVAAMRSVLQAAALYAGENNGQIPTMRWDTETNILRNPTGNRWVANTFWGRLQPYLFPDITTQDQFRLRDGIKTHLEQLFGTQDLEKMSGTPFEGARVYKDTSTLPVPFAFNAYIKAWNVWVTQQQIYSLPRTIYMTYGFGIFTEADGQTYQPPLMPGEAAEGRRIYFLPSKKAIAGFLDGRVEFLEAPIPGKMIRIDGMDL